MKKFLLVFSILLIPALFLTVWIPFRDASALYDGVIRLHILAASDSEEEQALKLTVRDRILASFKDDINAQSSREEAERYLRENLETIEALAEACVEENGYDHEVTVTLDEEYYPTREYEGMRLPAGEYLSLRVLIGPGEGQNWWCMVYPPLCTSAGEAKEELSEAGFTTDQVRLLTEDENPEYVVRFKVVETVSTLWKKIKSWFS